MSENHYWTEFWKQHGAKSKNAPDQVQVLRTLNKQPIDRELWQKTLAHLDKHLEPQDDDIILDLCCGNGLISKHLSEKCASVTSVDVSEDLVHNVKDYPKILAIAQDVRTVDFPSEQFSKVFIYAGIQYFTDSEAITLIEKIYTWLKPNGILFLGDIPDKNRIWQFYNNQERRRAYIKNLKEHTPIIGNWFTKEFFDAVGEYLGFSKSTYIDQPNDQIYSKFRFDHKYVK